MSQTERIYWIDAQIRAQHYPNAKEVARVFEVSERTAYLDRDYMCNRLFAPIITSRRFGGWEYSEPGYQLPFLALSEEEASTLRRTLQSALTYLPPTDAEAVQHLTVKLSPYIRGLPVHGGICEANTERFLPGYPAPSPTSMVSDALLEQVRRALDERRRLRVVYYSAHRDATKERTIQPYLLLNWRGELYLIAYCESRGALRDFFLPRIRSYTLLDPPLAYEIAPDFDADRYLHQAFELRRGEPPVTVRVRFSAFQARWVRERQYHPTQQMEDFDNGGLLLTLHVSGTEEVKRWILGFGAEAEVIEPDSLRRQIREEIERLHFRYAINEII